MHAQYEFAKGSARTGFVAYELRYQPYSLFLPAALGDTYVVWLPILRSL